MVIEAAFTLLTTVGNQEAGWAFHVRDVWLNKLTEYKLL